MAADLTPHSRLGCQAVVNGDVTVEIPGWNRNYISEGGKSTLKYEGLSGYFREPFVQSPLGR